MVKEANGDTMGACRGTASVNNIQLEYDPHEPEIRVCVDFFCINLQKVGYLDEKCSSYTMKRRKNVQYANMDKAVKGE